MPNKDKLYFILLRIWYKEDIQTLKEHEHLASSWLRKYKNLPKTDRKSMEDALFWARHDLAIIQAGLAMMEGMQDHYDF